MEKQNLTEYQKGMVDTLTGILEMIFEETDVEMREIIFEKIDKYRPSNKTE